MTFDDFLGRKNGDFIVEYDFSNFAYFWDSLKPGQNSGQVTILQLSLWSTREIPKWIGGSFQVLIFSMLLFSHIDRILYYGIGVQYSKLSGTHFTWSFQAAIAMYYLAISRSE